jgi:hypothetical protein
MIAEFVFLAYQVRPLVCGGRCSSMTARIQLLLIVLGMLVVAALNASSPWGP